jgi:DNA-binding LytR/AlgR family response regulator
LPLRALGTRRRQQQQAAPASDRPASAAPTGNPFLRRIPERLGTDLLFIATEDHYLRVTTDRGSDLILFRLSDAVAELDPALGQQVHRSYWVAWGAVASVLRDGHRTVLVLTNGAKVPVSRPYARALRKSGRLGR